jgi:succinate dehydrogenase / fumarate reductase, membrane anchor subunit
MSHNPNSIRTPLARVRGLGAAKSGTGHFWMQRLTAVANIPLTLAMVVIVVMLAKLDYAGARALVANPLVGILLIAFLVSALVHMRLGMQVIIEDYVHEEGTKIVLILLNTFFAVLMGLASIYAILRIGFGG